MLLTFYATTRLSAWPSEMLNETITAGLSGVGHGGDRLGGRGRPLTEDERQRFSGFGQAVQFSDMAMYAAKRAGRNTWRFYEPSNRI